MFALTVIAVPAIEELRTSTTELVHALLQERPDDLGEARGFVGRWPRLRNGDL